MPHCLKVNFVIVFLIFKQTTCRKVSIPITREGMGFQIRASKPCIVHSVTHSGMAMNSGLVKGHAILTVRLFIKYFFNVLRFGN